VANRPGSAGLNFTGGKSKLRRGIAALFGRLHLDDILNAVLEQPSSRRRYQVLVYHKVSPDPHPYFPPLLPENFERQVLFLKRHYTLLDLEELVERCCKNSIPRKAVAISFDDGYRDNYDFAFPILRKHGIPATIFLTTSAIDNRQKIWHDRVFDSFRFATKQSAALILEDVIRRAKGMGSSERLEYVRKIEEQLAPNIPEEFKTPMLCWRQIMEMSKAGISFGSHTCTHPILSRENSAELRRELVNSKKEIEACLGRNTALLAYPNGQKHDFSSEVIKETREAGYKCAFTTIMGSNRRTDNLYTLKRGQPWQTDPGMFRLSFFLQKHFG
jgi:peptidoglycan/xylan/chitin deacetylase (PgdA/CDA1 family)